MTRQGETKAAKQALLSIGGINPNGLRVRHGTGTACGWLEIYASIEHAAGCTCVLDPDKPAKICDVCKAMYWNWYSTIENIVAIATGRDQYRDKRIGIHLDFD